MKFLLIFLLMPLGVFAQKKHHSPTITFFPFGYYRTETSLAFGGMVVSFFRLNKQDTVSRVSNVSTSFTYTLRNQILGDILYTLFTKNENYLFTGSVTYMKFPLYYFGTGTNSQNTNRVLVSQQNFNWTARAYRKISKNTFVGVEYNFNYLFDVFPLKNTPFEEQLRTSEGVNSGFGLLFVRDSRDNMQSAKIGNYQEIAFNSYHKIFGSKYNYLTLKADVRQYLPISTRQTLALQLLGLFTEGNFVPFHRQAMIGGEFLMRGYYNGRYRDNDLLACQLENRIEFSRRWGMVVFGAVGGVTDRAYKFDVKNIKITGGLGLRFAIKPQNRLKIRFDVGFSEEGFGIYSGLSEAF